MLDALAEAGLETPVFIGGYRIEQIQADYPQLTYCHNADWQHNNILASLFCAEEYMDDGFVCSYADILYRSAVVRRAVEHEADIALCVDTDWRARYSDRSQHPEEDGEKVVAEGDRVTVISRDIPAAEASGEYIGVARFSAEGARSLREHYHRMKAEYAGRIWRDGVPFAKAYLIHLFQEMLIEGLVFHMATTDGEYMEIDTEEDFALANARWSRENGG
jgi:choline kinase